MPEQQTDPETCGHNDEELTDESLVRCLECGRHQLGHPAGTLAAHHARHCAARVPPRWRVPRRAAAVAAVTHPPRWEA